MHASPCFHYWFCPRAADFLQCISAFSHLYPTKLHQGALRFFRHHVQLQPVRFARSSIPKQNRSHCVNVVNDGSPSRMRMVRRISLGMTTRPRSSIRRTIPVAFKRITSNFQDRTPGVRFAMLPRTCGLGEWRADRWYYPQIFPRYAVAGLDMSGSYLKRKSS